MGKVLTINADGTHSVEEKNSLLDMAIAGTFAIFGGADKAYTADIVRAGQVVTNVANTTISGIVTRRRAENGEAAFLGVFL